MDAVSRSQNFQKLHATPLHHVWTTADGLVVLIVLRTETIYRKTNVEAGIGSHEFVHQDSRPRIKKIVLDHEIGVSARDMWCNQFTYARLKISDS